MTKKTLLPILILLLACTESFAGAWVQKKGSGYSQLAFNYYKSNLLFSNDLGTIAMRRELTDITLQGYLEYGATDKITVLGIIPFKMLKTGNMIFETSDFTDTLEAGKLNKLGNISLGVQYGFLKKKYFVMSCQGRVDLKSSSYSASTGLRSGYDAWSFAPSLLGGSSYAFKLGIGIYAQAELGVNLRTNQYSHEFFAVAEAGAHYKQRVFFIFGVDIKQSFFNGNADPENAAHTATYVNDQEYIAYGFKLVGGITEHFGIGASYFSVFSANLLPRDSAKGVFVYYKWDKKEKAAATEKK